MQDNLDERGLLICEDLYFIFQSRVVARIAAIIIFFSASISLPLRGFTQSKSPVSTSELKKLSVEELMKIEVSIVSRTPQKLTEAASAVQVITGDDIKRSGAQNIPDALRLVTNLQVAQLNANAWIISSRGFNTIFANKLLVMIDGRTVYTPLFGGVNWELQNVLLEDVERIEVVSGPGGTLWGANAVNGIINIITKSTVETQGLYAAAAAGTFVKNFEALRYGGKIGEKLTFKVYGQHYDRNHTIKPDNSDNTDAWGMAQSGFQIDYHTSPSDSYMLQGNFYHGRKKDVGGNSDFNGQNVLARWNHSFSDSSDLMLQVFFDRYYRDDFPGQAFDKMKTLDADFQYRFPVAGKQSFLVGAGYRIVRDNVHYRINTTAILPEKKNLDLFNAFVQDEIGIGKRLTLTLGTKLLHNVYTNFEVQPSARLSFVPNDKSTLWSAVTRAVRTPSRLDVDLYIPAYPVPPPGPSVAGGPNFISEKEIAYELGYRIQPVSGLTFSLATFYNDYLDVYSVEALPGTATYQIQNGAKGKSWGAELSGTWQATSRWKLRSGFTYFDKKLESKPGHVFNPVYLGNDAKNQVLLQSVLDLPLNLHFDIIARYLDYLPQTIATKKVPSYSTFDARLAWEYKHLEVSVTGQNLGRKNHIEFGTLQIPRSIYAKIACRF